MKVISTKFCLLILIFCSFFQSIKCQEFKISGEVTGFEDQTPVFLLNPKNNSFLDTTYVVKDKFIFRGKSSQNPESKVVYIPYKNQVYYTYIYIADDNLQLEGDIKDFPNKLKVTGSKHHKIKTKYDEHVEKINTKIEIEKGKVARLQQEQKWSDSLQRLYFDKNGILINLNKEKIKLEKTFIEENLDTYYGLEILSFKKQEYSDKNLNILYKRIPEDLKHTEYAKSIQKYLEHPKLKIGDNYADFTAINSNGDIIKLSSFFNSEKYVLLDFSTPTCPYSIKALPMLQDLHNKYKDELNIVTFYTESKKEHFEYFVNLENNNWNFLWSQKGNNSYPYIRYRINSTPTYYLFDVDGKLIKKIIGFQKEYFDDTKNEIETLFELK